MTDHSGDLVNVGSETASEESSFAGLAWNSRMELRHHAGSSLRYYRRRQRFFDALDKLTKITPVAVAMTFLAEQATTKQVASMLAYLTLLDLIFGY